MKWPRFHERPSALLLLTVTQLAKQYWEHPFNPSNLFVLLMRTAFDRVSVPEQLAMLLRAMVDIGLANGHSLQEIETLCLEALRQELPQVEMGDEVEQAYRRAFDE